MKFELVNNNIADKAIRHGRGVDALAAVFFRFIGLIYYMIIDNNRKISKSISYVYIKIH